MSLAALDPEASAADTPRPPLVSIVVRSMGRPELALALRALADQDHPRLEVIVVDATGGAHPPLPHVAWQPGHTLRMVGGAQRLARPHAANAGLEAVRGEWFSFLDDDDTCEPSHVSSLLAAAARHPEALVVYGQGRLYDAQGQVESLFGHPFNRALMHYGPLCYWQASLIRTRVRDLGCRFDPAFDVCEDRDLLAQIAQHGDFAFVPLATLNYRPDLGTSGTGRGANRNDARRVLYDARLKAKWSGPGTYHWARVAGRCRRGVRAFESGDIDGAQRWFERALADYPGDPNAMNGLARVALARGDVDTALRHALEAVRVNPTAPDYAETLRLVQRACGMTSPAQRASDTPDAARVPPAPLRMDRCACGSGRRYKACCGRLADAQARHARDTAYRTASTALARGDAELAYRTLAEAEPAAVDPEYGMLLEACCERICIVQRDAGRWAMARQLLQRIGARAMLARNGHRAATAGVHDTTILAVADEHASIADRLDLAAPARVVFDATATDPAALIERLVEVEECGAAIDVQVDLPATATSA
jgi:tetratricopeptide (TPR) repeat protein